MISTMTFHSKSSKESKSTLGSSKNLAKRSRSGFKVSDENALHQKRIQKSILKFLSCSSYSPHQNPLKIEPKTMRNRPQKLLFMFGRNCPKTHKNGEIKEERGREITSGDCPDRRQRERDEGGGRMLEREEERERVRWRSKKRRRRKEGRRDAVFKTFHPKRCRFCH